MKKLVILFFIIVCSGVNLFSQPVSKFKDGDRVVFLGNSITDGGHYHSFIWLFYMTRFPNMDLLIMNAGIGGDTAYDMYKRLDDDVFCKRPTVLVVTFGMNDSGYFEYNSDKAKEFGEEKYQTCYKNFKMLEKRLLELPNTRIVMMGSSPYDENVKINGNIPFKGKNAVMQRIVEFQKQAAQEHNWEFLDLNQPMTAINQKFQQTDSTFTLCGLDRIHPDNDGHMVMAYLFLKEQGFAGNKVADIEINASKGSIIKSTNCGISNLKKDGNKISFDYLAYSLPYPLDTMPRGWNSKKSQAQAIKYVPFIDEMNQEILKITGLKGNYKLMIDDNEIGTWSSDDFAKGINLASETKTPQYQQALAVMYLNEYRWEIERNFREYAWIQFDFFQQKGLLFADNQEAVNVLDKEIKKTNDIWLKMHRDNYAQMMHKSVREAREEEMKLLISKIYEINKPVTRKITLKKI
ncbi:MAG TPA: SGNH/GDSL hydrolase family protein [Paludibacteraceae bacterium]|nr:SGNH/GDSL hydrolase family protein [Paludibacteraceae bacterium]HOK99928.1 SGNH/GDSL hydrolase family protein [Paludibacteraceae bacterium]HPO66737.1 SGNH/GDSL hydrolase family protein [Paludibacteraceae bacterium]